MSDIGTKIKEAMARKGLNQRKLAEMLEIPPATLSRYISGARTPKAEVLATLAQALGISVDYLLDIYTQNEKNRGEDQSQWTRNARGCVSCASCGYEPTYVLLKSQGYSNANFCPNCGKYMINREEYLPYKTP